MRRMILAFFLITALVIGSFLYVQQRQKVTLSTSTCVDIPANPDYLASGRASDAIAAIDNARAREHLPRLRLPANFYTLDAARQQFVLLNLERTDRGLRALRFDTLLARIATNYSRQMRDLGFFAHTSPISGTFEERMNAHPAIANHFAVAAENLAGNPVAGAGALYEYMYDDSVEACGHRHNILDPQLNFVGIGWVPGSSYGSISAQEFLSSAPWNPYVGVTSIAIQPSFYIEEILPPAPRIDDIRWMHHLPPREDSTVRNFRVVLRNTAHIARITWFLDSNRNAPDAGMQLSLNMLRLSPGTHTLLVYAVNDEQQFVLASYRLFV